MRKITASFMTILLGLLLTQCVCNRKNKATDDKMFIQPASITTAIGKTAKTYGQAAAVRAEKGISQCASLWKKEDGSQEKFIAFCEKYFVNDAQEREILFQKMSRNFESLLGHFNKISLDMQWALHIDEGKLTDIDHLFGAYDAGSHLTDDFYKSKIAFITVLNFPFFSLDEKTKEGSQWSAKEWAYARLGDLYTARVPAEKMQDYAIANMAAESYIADYNIYVGHLLNNKGESLFPKNLKLLSHWNLRDQIKAGYNEERGLEKQQIIYEAMKRIITQEIPQMVINSDKVEWNPYENKVFKNGKAIEFKQEPDTRYQRLLDNFKALRAMDAHYPESMDTYIERKFAVEMEIAQPEVEKLFKEFLASPKVKEVAQLIRSRLKRDLQPFDIWYDGFKARSGLAEEKLDKIVNEKYPNAMALEKDIATILMKLGFQADKAKFLASRIQVDDARGSGHAWGPEMKLEKAHLRTRVPDSGMNYKGYNIAVHELGHNVEQTISIHDVDHYMMRGVPNTAFTEALAFIFQSKDLQLLDIKDPASGQAINTNKEYFMALDTFWSVYEIMGVSLVDMYVWQWLYQHPDANAKQLKEEVVRLCRGVWNKYFAPVLGSRDEILLGIYSHMISYPLYLSAYSYGHLIDFQLQQHLEGKNFAEEVQRMFSMGRLTPQLWMKRAVGKGISVEPLQKAVTKK